MTCVLTIDPVMVSFFSWISSANYSNSHTLDDQRFYCFVRTLYRYIRTDKKWLRHAFFERKGNEFGCHSKDFLTKHFGKMMTIMDFLKSNGEIPFIPKKSSLTTDDFVGFRYKAQILINNRIEWIEITEDEYKKPISKKALLEKYKELK